MADNTSVVAEGRGVDRIDRDAALHIAKLSYVVVKAVDRCPTKQRITDSLQRLLVFNDALSLMRMPGRVSVDVSRNDRAPGLLELQKHHVNRTAALEQSNVRTQADAGYPDHLVRDVDQRVSAEHAAPLRRQCAQILFEPPGDVIRLGFGHSRD